MTPTEELLAIERAREKREKAKHAGEVAGGIFVLIVAGPPIALILWVLFSII